MTGPIPVRSERSNDAAGRAQSRLTAHSASQSHSFETGPTVHTTLPAEAPESAQIGDEAVIVSWADGTSIRLLHLWLRDNCPCPQCQVIGIGEHRVVIGDQPPDLRPVEATVSILLTESVETEPSWSIEVRWPDHESVFSLADLQRLLVASHRGSRRITAWASEFSPPTFDHDTVIIDTTAADEMFGAFAEFGAVVIAGCPTEPGTVEAFISRFVPVREMAFGRVHDVAVTAEAYNVAHTAEALPPHNDFASMSWPPSGQALHMLVNDTEGGDTIIVDGWRLSEELRRDNADGFQALCRVPVGFRMFSETVETWARQPLVRCDAEGRVVHLRYSNQLMQPLDPQHPDLATFYRGYHALSRAVADTANQAHFRLEAGHMLLVHGHRVLHGRTAFTGSGARHLQDTYFDFDDILAPLSRPS